MIYNYIICLNWDPISNFIIKDITEIIKYNFVFNFFAFVSPSKLTLRWSHFFKGKKKKKPLLNPKIQNVILLPLRFEFYLHLVLRIS